MPDDAFYAPTGSALEQGDIIDKVPWGLIEAPATLCRPDNRTASSGKAFYGAATALKRPLAWALDPEYIHGICWNGLAMVLWHGCQIDKWKNQERKNADAVAFAAIAPIIQLDRYEPAEKRADVSAGKHYLVLPPPHRHDWRPSRSGELR